MVKVELVSSDPHNPLGGIVRVDNDRVGELLATGKYKLKSEAVAVVIEKVPDAGWTEKEVKDWIVSRNVPVEYDIKRDSKKEILERLKAGGFIR